ncbi:hypothetical protein JCM10207_004788 [Rhodosporidiobolus poonsookiae]
MSVPPLPLELIGLIFDHLEVDLPDKERRQLAFGLMRVCKQWTNFARTLAWRSVTVVHGDDEDFLRGRAGARPRHPLGDQGV